MQKPLCVRACVSACVSACVCVCVCVCVCPSSLFLCCARGGAVLVGGGVAYAGMYVPACQTHVSWHSQHFPEYCSGCTATLYNQLLSLTCPYTIVLMRYWG